MPDDRDATLTEGLPVPGYRPQPARAIETVSALKEAEERLLRRLDALAAAGEADPRWLAIGRTGLEQAFMAINRAVFRPGRVRLEADAEAGP
ncbi:MAG: cyclic nucleotide-binding protein [Alphaproteobacteria bacterium]